MKTNPFGWHIYTLTREYLPSINHLAIVFPIPVAVLSYKKPWQVAEQINWAWCWSIMISLCSKNYIILIIIM